jgi:hypothetical protein
MFVIFAGCASVASQGMTVFHQNAGHGSSTLAGMFEPGLFVDDFAG